MAVILDENFEGSGYELSGWSETVDGSNTLDEDSVVPGTPHAGAGSQCLKAICADATDNDAHAVKVVSSTSVNYVRGYIYVGPEGLGDGEVTFDLLLRTTALLLVAGVKITQAAGQLSANLFYFDNTGGGLFDSTVSNISINTWYRVEYKYDITGSSWEFRVAGSTIDSGSLIDPTRTPDTIQIGQKSHSGSASTTLYTNSVIWDDANWPGPAAIERTLSSSIVINDPQTRYLLAQRRLISNLIVDDTLGVSKLLSRLLSSATTVSDTIIISTLLNRILESGLNVSDTISVVSNLTRSLIDGIDLSDFIVRTIIADNLINRLLQDNVNIQDAISVEVWLLRTLGDSIDISDLLIRTVSTGAIIYERILQSGIDIVDSISVQSHITRCLVDTLALVDSISRDALLCRILSDNVDIIDSISKESAFIILRTLVDSIDINDTLVSEIAVLITGIIITRLERESITMGLSREDIKVGLEGYNE